MKTGRLICYTLGSRPTVAERTKFRKRFLGYTDFSNKSQYKYHRKGLLSEIPHIKIIRSVVIVRNEDCNRIVDFLKKYNATIFVKSVILTLEDRKKLQVIG
jgi:hypothetical protein